MSKVIIQDIWSFAFCQLASPLADSYLHAAYSFDEPGAFDTPALVQCLQALRVSAVLSNVRFMMN